MSEHHGIPGAFESDDTLPLLKQEPRSSPILESGPNHFGLIDDDGDEDGDGDGYESSKVTADSHASTEKERAEDDGEEYVVNEVVDSDWERDVKVSTSSHSLICSRPTTPSY